MKHPWEPALLPNGDIRLPRRAEGDEVLGDGVEIVTPDDKRYEDLLEEIKQAEDGQR